MSLNSPPFRTTFFLQVLRKTSTNFPTTVFSQPPQIFLLTLPSISKSLPNPAQNQYVMTLSALPGDLLTTCKWVPYFSLHTASMQRKKRTNTNTVPTGVRLFALIKS